MPQGIQVIAFENIEHLQHMHAARGWRWHGADAVAAIVATDRRTLDNLIADQVFMTD